MYCRIKNIECKYAGELIIKNAPDLNGDNKEHVYTMCHYDKGSIHCPNNNKLVQ